MEELAFDDFSLWIEALDGGSGYRVRAHSPAGEVSETMSSLPVSAREPSIPSGARDASWDTRTSVRDIAAFQGPDYDVRRYGDELFRALLPGRVGLLLASSLGVLPDPRRGLRIKLHFDPSLPSAAALCSLPWELLYNAETKDYLGINPLTPLVRYLEVPRSTQVGSFEPPNFMEHQLVLYQCVLDLTTGKPLNESADEYFYKDVVSAATQSKSITCELDKKALVYFPQAKKAIVNGKLQLNSAEHFVLTTSGGTSISMVLSDPTLAEGLGGGTIPTQLADQAVQAVRKMLREKKAS